MEKLYGNDSFDCLLAKNRSSESSHGPIGTCSSSMTLNIQLENLSKGSRIYEMCDDYSSSKTEQVTVTYSLLE